MSKMLTIGALALQGDFSKHLEVLRQLGVNTKEVRTPADLSECDGLIIPGGESTCILRQMDFIGLRQPLEAFAQQKPIFGTCAGLIILSKQVRPAPMSTLGLLDITVQRNAFGRQADSFHAKIDLQLSPEHKQTAKGFFIRAPRIIEVQSGVEVLASYNGEAVLVRQGRHLGASFHPELTQDPTLHRYFLQLCAD